VIDELQRVKDFGTSQPPPSETARNAARSALAQAIADAERQHQQAPAPVNRRRFREYVRAPRLLPIGAAVAVAGAAALFFTAPWRDSPSFLARAEAALTPQEGMILHEKWVDTSISPHFKCTVTSTAEIWLDPHSESRQRYRALLRDPFRLGDPYRPAPPVCSRGSAYEIGGLWDEPALRFVPPNRLVQMPMGGPPNVLLGSDRIVGDLRRALSAGRARDEGRTKRDGRTVEHISLEWGDAYVDPDTFYPVEIDLPGTPYRPAYADPGSPRQEIRFKTYEYLPRTAANLALTNIRAQHPHARLAG
jgi:hypothetical protein